MASPASGEPAWSGKFGLSWLVQLLRAIVHRAPAPESVDYRKWRHQFMLDRLQISLWIALPFFLTSATHSIFIAVVQADQFREDVAKFYGDAALADQFIQMTLIACPVITLLLLSSQVLLKTRWGQRHPAVVFLLLSWSLTLAEHIVGTFFGIPVVPDTMVFLAQAALIPVYWRLHLVAQMVPVLYYLCVYPLLGITQLGDRSIFDSYAIGAMFSLMWICLICDLAVYLYERLKRSEFESKRQLQVFLHSVSHDLRTPVMGTAMVLRGLLNSPDERFTIRREVVERLLEGSDRQLMLINSLLEAHKAEVQNDLPQVKPQAIAPIVESVLADLAPLLEKNQIHLENRITADLPPVAIDADQIWRVFCNLINNALKHNPNQITLLLEAEVISSERLQQWIERSFVHTTAQPLKIVKAVQQRIGWRSTRPALSTSPWMLCRVQDDGVGIPPQHCERLFELYFRGPRARYMPGLGLGLYLCRQIVRGHGGEMGVMSQLHEGTTFWLTLPLANCSEEYKEK